MDYMSGLVMLIGVCWLIATICAIPFIIAWYFGVLSYFTIFVIIVAITAWIVSKSNN